MREAVIVSTARTPIGKAFRGGFNNIGGASLGAASVAEAVKRAGVDPARVEDVIMGAALQQGATGSNIARQIALRAGLPVTTSGMTMDRQCSSGLMAVAVPREAWAANNDEEALALVEGVFASDFVEGKYTDSIPIESHHTD